MTRAPVSSIELLLDEDSEAAVRAEWDALAAAGLSSLAAHTAPSNRPHITLLARSVLGDIDAATLSARPVFAVRLGSPMLFGEGDRRVLVHSVVPSVELLALHDEVHRAVGPGDDAPYTTPGAWTPHVTISRRLRLQDLERALALVGGQISGTAQCLRRWDAATRTVTELGHLARSRP